MRELQRRHALSVLVVYHARKFAGRVRARQALRSSSEFHAWGDRTCTCAAQATNAPSPSSTAQPSPANLTLELQARGEALALHLAQRPSVPAPAPASVDERITAALKRAGHGALPISQLRTLCHVRNAALYERLVALTSAGQLRRSPDGYQLATG